MNKTNAGGEFMSKFKQTRRTFLKAAGIGAAALFIPGCEFSEKPGSGSKAAAKKPLPQAGLQLWTIRQAIEQDLGQALGRIAEMGYMGVETARLPVHITHKQVGQELKKLGLTVMAAHCEIPIGSEKEVWLEMVEAYGCRHMIWHGWPGGDRYSSLDNIKQTIDVYNEANSFAKSNGLLFGLHNHWWEFEEVDGIIPFSYLVEKLDQDIFFEIDTYWAKTAGFDPARVVADLGARAPFIHIKDGPAPKGEIIREQVPAGQGTLDFPAIAKAGKDADWMIVEFDACATDMMEAVHESYRYLIQNGLARGNV
jgi:sugar phosphate isomerase/epimerase